MGRTGRNDNLVKLARAPWNLASCIVLVLCVGISEAQSPKAVPKTYEIDGQWLAQAGAMSDSAIVKAARAEADSAMHSGPFTVTAKDQTPPSGDKHDYLSLARYYWPNPTTATHLPYIRKDGQSNPQIEAIPDHTNLFKMIAAVHTLALGYELTGREEYAARATMLLRVWFLNPETRMNPNLEYSQAVLGVNGGRGRGILDARRLPDVADGIAMIASSKSWTPEDQRGMIAWFTQYYQWLRTSENGKVEEAATNNHGSWYMFQAVGIALFLGKQEDARAMLMKVQERIASQIQKDGKQPLELARTKSFDYSVFNLEALMRLADYGQLVGVNLWKYEAPNGGSIRVALDYLMPFATKSEHWKFEEIEGFNGSSLRSCLLNGALHFRDPQYLEASSHLEGKDTAEILLQKSKIVTPR
jgi:hypothetical protein